MFWQESVLYLLLASYFKFDTLRLENQEKADERGLNPFAEHLWSWQLREGGREYISMCAFKLKGAAGHRIIKLTQFIFSPQIISIFFHL